MPLRPSSDCKKIAQKTNKAQVVSEFDEKWQILQSITRLVIISLSIDLEILMLSQSRLITTQQHTEQASLLRWVKNAWRKLKRLTKLISDGAQPATWRCNVPSKRRKQTSPRSSRVGKLLPGFLQMLQHYSQGEGKKIPPFWKLYGGKSSF